MPEGIPGYLRIRVIKRFDAGNAEVTNDLPHLHQSKWTVAAMQPGNPGSTALGSFTIPLHPPGSEGYAAAKATYDSLARYQRVEAYISPDGASLGKLAFAGVITGIRKTYGTNSAYELTGVSDLGLANMSRPFPGELLSNDVTSAIVKSYFGTNELGWSDTFSPFTAANYTSTNLPGNTAGTWSSGTDDGFNVVTISTGTGAAFLSKTGAAANDRWHCQYVEVTGRLKPSTDATNAGAVGVGINTTGTTLNDGVMGYFTAQATSAGRWNLAATLARITGSLAFSPTIANLLLNSDDPQGFIPFTVGLLVSIGGNSGASANMSLMINGRVVIGQYPIAYDPGTVTRYPFLFFGAAATGTATAYMTNFVQMTRFTTDGPATTAAFGNGTLSTSTRSLGYGVDPGPTFLEAWSRLATREGWYWRYTPQAYVVGTRTLGTVDYAADPGTDLTNSVIFRRDQGNLVDLQFNNNGDPLAADTALSGQSTLDGGGIGYWRDVGTLGKYGVIQDEALSFTHSDFNSLRRAAYQVNANKIALDTLGAKTAVVLRDPQVADTYRELDKITIHDPEMGLNYQSVRIMARTFTEGQATETLLLDQFSENFVP